VCSSDLVQPQDQPGRSAPGEHTRIGPGNARSNQKGIGSRLGQVLQNLSWIENSRYDTQVQAVIERDHGRPAALRMEYPAQANGLACAGRHVGLQRIHGLIYT